MLVSTGHLCERQEPPPGRAEGLEGQGWVEGGQVCKDLRDRPVGGGGGENRVMKVLDNKIS